MRIAFGDNGGYRVELVSPMGKGDSPVAQVLKREGNAPYHVCYASGNLERDVEELRRENYKVIIPPMEAKAFGGRRVVFLMHLSVGMIEVVEEKEVTFEA